MANVAVIETKPSRNQFKEFEFEFDRYCLCSDSSIKTVRKKDVDIEFNPDAYEWIILVGKDAFSYYTKKTAITDYSGKLVDGKFLPTINPAMITFKPDAAPLWAKSKDAINGYISGVLQPSSGDTSKFPGIDTEEAALAFIQEAIDHPNKYVAIDSETTGLYPLDGYVQGVSISYKKDWGAYISADCFTEEVTALFQVLIRKKIVVFHNAKFDIPFIEYHLGVTFHQFEDTMLIHYALEENPGTHGLKQLALIHTKYGDYEGPLNEWIADYISKNGLLKKDFKWEFIPFEVMVPYAAGDSVVTLLIFSELMPKLAANPKLLNVYRNILLPACRMLVTMQQNGVPFDPERLQFGQQVMSLSIEKSVASLYSYKAVCDYKEEKGDFNPNSPKQLRELLFDRIGLIPTGKKTATGAISTDAEVLKELADQHDIPKAILNIRKKSKLKNTYLDKIIVNLNTDWRLRTNFNLHGTTSGRLSSSGKMNMQQLPRDGSVVKGSIKARDGYKIVSMDLKTAEVYLAAILSGDKALQQIFIDDLDFHSAIAHKVFGLTCKVEEVKDLYPELRQAGKTVTFSILYQAGPHNVSNTINKDAKEYGLDLYFSLQDAVDAIDSYFKQFPKLKKWLEANKKDIATKGFTYSCFGRKRRLPNVKSDNGGVAAHAVRSGLNFLVQSPSSDVNLMAAVDIQNYLDLHPELDAKLFALVHDSILAEVREDQVEEYMAMVKKFVQKDRGVSIPRTPIGCDFEVGDDYSFGKFDKEYGEIFQVWKSTPVEHRQAVELGDYI